MGTVVEHPYGKGEMGGKYDSILKEYWRNKHANIILQSQRTADLQLVTALRKMNKYAHKQATFPSNCCPADKGELDRRELQTG